MGYASNVRKPDDATEIYDDRASLTPVQCLIMTPNEDEICPNCKISRVAQTLDRKRLKSYIPILRSNKTCASTEVHRIPVKLNNQEKNCRN